MTMIVPSRSVAVSQQHSRVQHEERSAIHTTVPFNREPQVVLINPGQQAKGGSEPFLAGKCNTSNALTSSQHLLAAVSQVEQRAALTFSGTSSLTSADLGCMLSGLGTAGGSSLRLAGSSPGRETTLIHGLAAGSFLLWSTPRTPRTAWQWQRQ